MKPLNLQEYAMAYLARYNNTEKGLVRVLKAKMRRWAMRAESEGVENIEIEDTLKNGQQQIIGIIVKVKNLGIVNDLSFAESKVNSLIRSGRSQKVIQNKLLQKGIAFDVIQSVLDQYQGKETELLAALVYARKRRVGPFRRIDREVDMELKQKEKLTFARGGFSFGMMEQVLSMDRIEAEEAIQELRFL